MKDRSEDDGRRREDGMILVKVIEGFAIRRNKKKDASGESRYTVESV